MYVRSCNFPEAHANVYFLEAFFVYLNEIFNSGTQVYVWHAFLTWYLLKEEHLGLTLCIVGPHADRRPRIYYGCIAARSEQPCVQLARKLLSAVQALATARRQHGDLISLLYFFKE
jgi:hypothetical protein